MGKIKYTLPKFSIIFKGSLVILFNTTFKQTLLNVFRVKKYVFLKANDRYGSII